VLLTFDALRGDLIESKAWSKRLPNFKKLRKSSLRFERAWSAAPATRQSLSGLFLGRYASQLRWERPRKKGGKRAFLLPAKDQGPHFPMLLQRAGVDTLNIVGYSTLSRGHGITEGFARQLALKSYAPSEEMVAAVLKELAARPTGPLFVYAHNMDAHAPYNRGRRKGSQLDRYRGEVEMIDNALGALRAGVKELGLSDRLYLIVSSDHGEAFYEHGRRFHAQTVYEEMIRVPLYLSGPGIKARHVRDSASLIDLGPTVLDLFGQATPGHYMGQSLVPLFAGGKARLTRPLAVDSASTKHMRGVLFENRYKAMEHVKSGAEEVYDLQADPGETVNLAETPEGKRYIAAARAFFRIHTPAELEK
jgi:arylsulfatase A-like enzyme